jgi:predicted Zn-dependent peptidase
MYFGRFFTVDHITTEVNAVTREDIQRLANDLIHQDKLALTLLGNLGGLKIDRESLIC